MSCAYWKSAVRKDLKISFFSNYRVKDIGQVTDEKHFCVMNNKSNDSNLEKH